MSLVTSKNHWWQNWPKTHAYVAGTMCFPRNIDELSAAVRLAEGSSLPVRAIACERSMVMEPRGSLRLDRRTRG